MQNIGYDAFLVGSTVGQVGIYSSVNNRLIKMLFSEGLSVYEMVHQPKTKRIALACDGGMVLLFETDAYEKVGQISVQQNDITSLMYVRADLMIVCQVLGYIDVLLF